jgi:hypothetical protein
MGPWLSELWAHARRQAITWTDTDGREIADIIRTEARQYLDRAGRSEEAQIEYENAMLDERLQTLINRVQQGLPVQANPPLRHPDAHPGGRLDPMKKSIALAEEARQIATGEGASNELAEDIAQTIRESVRQALQTSQVPRNVLFRWKNQLASKVEELLEEVETHRSKQDFADALAAEIRERAKVIAREGFDLPEQARKDAVHVIHREAREAIGRGDTPAEMEAIAANWTDEMIIGWIRHVARVDEAPFPERQENENIRTDAEGNKRFVADRPSTSGAMLRNPLLLTGGAAAIGVGLAWVYF